MPLFSYHCSVRKHPVEPLSVAMVNQFTVNELPGAQEGVKRLRLAKSLMSIEQAQHRFRLHPPDLLTVVGGSARCSVQEEPSVFPVEAVPQRLIDDFKGRFPGFDISRFSDNWKRLRVMAGGLLGVYHHQSILTDDLSGMSRRSPLASSLSVQT